MILHLRTAGIEGHLLQKIEPTRVSVVKVGRVSSLYLRLDSWYFSRREIRVYLATGRLPVKLDNGNLGLTN